MAAAYFPKMKYFDKYLRACFHVKAVTIVNSQKYFSLIKVGIIKMNSLI